LDRRAERSTGSRQSLDAAKGEPAVGVDKDDDFRRRSREILQARCKSEAFAATVRIATRQAAPTWPGPSCSSLRQRWIRFRPESRPGRDRFPNWAAQRRFSIGAQPRHQTSTNVSQSQHSLPISRLRSFSAFP
jgi:hypothetical protein